MSEARLEKMALPALLAMAHKRNPKDHDIDSLVSSFVRFGFIAFPTIDEASETMVAGHGRCEGLERMRTVGVVLDDKSVSKDPPAGITVDAHGTWMVPVIRGIDFKSERERDAYVIADNQNVMAGGWKFDVLSELLGELRDDGGFDGLGFESIELDALLGQYEQEPPSDGQDPEQMTTTSSSDRGRTEITARIECPHCHTMFER